MLHPTPETFRRDLDVLSQRLQALRQEFQQHDVDAHAVLDRIQHEKDSLAARLSDAQRKGTNWDLIKAEFGGAWNKFVMDLELLEVKLLDAESTKQPV